MQLYLHPHLSGIRSSLLLTALLASLTVATLTRAQGPVVTATLTGSNGSSTVNITSNQSFTLTLTVQTNFVSEGVSYRFISNAAGSGLFRITGFDATGSPYPPSPLICSGPGDPCLLDPSNDNDLGRALHGGTVPAGTYMIATFTFSTMNAPVGQYTISTLTGVVLDRTSGNFENRPFSANATINVVPEPSTVGLALLGGAALSVVAWRRRRSDA